MSSNTSNTSTIARVVWDTADKFLRNIVEETEYGDYILPFTVLRRLECLLEPTKDDVVALVASLGDIPETFVAAQVKAKFGQSFFNVSPLSLTAIASTDDSVGQALKDYISGFSTNISDIWTNFEFSRLVTKLDEENILHSVVNHFSSLDLSVEALPNTSMGDLFEDVMYRAFDKKGKSAGAFYTPRDAIKLMVDILFASDEESLTGRNALRSIYDPTAGTGGMLLEAQEHLTKLNPDIEVNLFGQEIMPSAFALGKADLLIQGGSPEAIRKENTLRTDEWADHTFDYVLSNPPFGMDWSKDEVKVKEQAAIPGTRFSHGLPKKTDGQMLFLAHCASKLSPAGTAGHGGRAAVVSNASPLFSSDAGSTSIRQWLFESDLIDSIIALPTQMFYGTGIATYVWILDTNKEDQRKGTIQLIDASGQFEPMRKPMGDKRREMTAPKRKVVHEAYKAFREADSTISRVMKPADFMFRDVPVFKQARLATVFSENALVEIEKHKDYAKAHRPLIEQLNGTEWNTIPARFSAACKAAGLKTSVSLANAVSAALGVQDDEAPLAVDRKGEPVLAAGWKIMERVPMSEDLEGHMIREVLPFAEGAQWAESKAKYGNEIPFTRIFYVPEEPRSLEEIDADVARLMGELSELFKVVHEDA